MLKKVQVLEYSYERDGVKLHFSFFDDEKLEENKRIFIKLMEEAKKELQ